MTLSARDTVYAMAVTTVPSVEVGRRLVRELVERRLIACGTICPGARSVYRWRGSVEEADEAVILMKTRVARWDDLKRAFPALHPYQTPELILVPIADGHAPYLDWLSTET